MRAKVKAVRTNLGQRSWRRRVIALAMAYAVAVSSLVAGFGAARAAAEAAFDPAGAICHHSPTGRSNPLSGHRNGNTCIDCCSVGCLMPAAALPPPLPIATPARVALAYRLAPLAIVPLAGARTAKSHRSRAPPA